MRTETKATYGTSTSLKGNFSGSDWKNAREFAGRFDAPESVLTTHRAGCERPVLPSGLDDVLVVVLLSRESIPPGIRDVMVSTPRGAVGGSEKERGRVVEGSGVEEEGGKR